MATAVQYQNKVNAYFEATLARSASAAELALWTQNLVNTNGNVWSGLGLQQHVSQLAGWGNNIPFTTALATARVNAVLTNMFGNHTGVSQTVKDYYVNNMVAGTIKERGLVNAIINDLGLMPKVDGTYGSPAGWEAGPAGANSPALVTAAQRLAWESNVENLSGGEFLMSANTDFADGTGSFNGVLPTPFKFTNGDEVVYAPAGTLQAADTLLDTNWGQLAAARDSDVLYIGANRAFSLPGAGNAPTIRGIETIIIQGDDAILGTMDFSRTTFAQRIYVEGTLTQQQTLLNPGITGATYLDFSDARPSTGSNAGVSMAGILSAGNDTIIGSAGSDILRGGAGDDRITSGLGNDVIYTGTGFDRVTLNGGTNTVRIDAHDGVAGDINYITATSGTNTVIMEVASTVTLAGNANLNIGASTVGVNVQGSAGNDVIIGGQGSDVIRGGAGVDDMTSGWLATTFQFAAGDTPALGAINEADIIRSFVAGVDNIKTGTAGTAANYVEADGTAIANYGALVAAADAALGGAVVYYVAYNFNNTGDAYLFWDTNGNGAYNAGVDVMIQLVGAATAADINWQDIIA
ncbi:Hemolysin-type calcium-binding repeat-containing protein [Desulfonatronum zhilinae]|nr:Hemolysin-type calcium-binding repeat-containing protein [Desulfonatronum zhilinae]